MKQKNKGITLIALVITIIVLLILAGIAISTLTGDNGVLTKATNSAIETDIAETKEQIKLEIMGNTDDEGNYTNTDVIKAVKKITGKDIDENTINVKTLKGNDVDLSDLWVAEEEKVVFTVNEREVTLRGEELWSIDETGTKNRKKFAQWLIDSTEVKYDYFGAAAGWLLYVGEGESGSVELFRNGVQIYFDWYGAAGMNDVIESGDVWEVRGTWSGVLVDIWGEDHG